MKSIHILFSSVQVGGGWSASHPGHFTTGKRGLGTRCIEDWMGPRAGLDDVENRKFLTLPGLELSDPSVVQPVVSRYTD
jgi:hypothetical protein